MNSFWTSHLAPHMSLDLQDVQQCDIEQHNQLSISFEQSEHRLKNWLSAHMSEICSDLQKGCKVYPDQNCQLTTLALGSTSTQSMTTYASSALPVLIKSLRMSPVDFVMNAAGITSSFKYLQRKNLKTSTGGPQQWFLRTWHRTLCKKKAYTSFKRSSQEAHFTTLSTVQVHYQASKLPGILILIILVRSILHIKESIIFLQRHVKVILTGQGLYLIEAF